MDGGAGNDTMGGGAGDDCMKGGAGADAMNGGAGADIMLGEEGADTMNGDSGNDFLDGGDGNDKLNGGDGNDWIAGSAGADQMSGGAGADIFVHRQDEDADGTLNTILDWDSGDIIRLCGQDNLFYVTKIEFQARDVDGIQNDVLVLLSDASKILIKNAAADFTPGNSFSDGIGMEFKGNNVDDFQHVDESNPLHDELCFVDCDDPVVQAPPTPIDFCDEQV
jgi:Ca2+-binding RTX toxin-like protein